MSDQPKYEEKAFFWPFCNVYAHMAWYWLFDGRQGIPFRAAQCANCAGRSIWLINNANQNGSIVYPDRPFVTPLTQACLKTYFAITEKHLRFIPAHLAELPPS